MVYGIKTVKLWKQKRRKEGNHNVYSSNIQVITMSFNSTVKRQSLIPNNMNFPMGMKWQSCHGIMRLPSGIWVY